MGNCIIYERPWLARRNGIDHNLGAPVARTVFKVMNEGRKLIALGKKWLAVPKV